jgi:hypothetical protein
MYSGSISSGNPVVEQFNLNKQNLSNLKRDISPLADSALQLAQTAREIKANVAKTTGNSRTLVTSNRGGSIESRELINMLGRSKDALKDFAAKAKSLDQEVDFFSAHQQQIFSGNVGGIPQADKVNWSTGQVEKILKRASKLGAEQAGKVSTAVRDLERAALYVNKQIHSDLGSKVNTLNRHIH